jgi:hypothetical protein
MFLKHRIKQEANEIIKQSDRSSRKMSRRELATAAQTQNADSIESKWGEEDLAAYSAMEGCSAMVGTSESGQ